MLLIQHIADLCLGDTMSRLTDIYNSLMDDPDIVPPAKISKDEYVLNMARQRIQQSENNAEALEMGFVKTNGHFSNGYSNNGGSQSAVNKLAAFVNLPEASPDTDILLEKAKEPQHFHEDALQYLLDRNYSNAVIEQLRKDHPPMATSSGKPILEISLKDIASIIPDRMAVSDDARIAGEERPTAKSHPAMFKPAAKPKTATSDVPEKVTSKKKDGVKSIFPIKWESGNKYNTDLKLGSLVRNEQGDLFKVNRLNGYNVELDGINEKGQSRGSTSNITINVDPSVRKQGDPFYYPHKIGNIDNHNDLLDVGTQARVDTDTSPTEQESTQPEVTPKKKTKPRTDAKKTPTKAKPKSATEELVDHTTSESTDIEPLDVASGQEGTEDEEEADITLPQIQTLEEIAELNTTQLEAALVAKGFDRNQIGKIAKMKGLQTDGLLDQEKYRQYLQETLAKTVKTAQEEAEEAVVTEAKPESALDARLKEIDPAYNKATVITRLSSLYGGGYRLSELEGMSDDELVARVKISSEDISHSRNDIEQVVSRQKSGDRRLRAAGYTQENITEMSDNMKNTLLNHLDENPTWKRGDIDAAIKREGVAAAAEGAAADAERAAAAESSAGEKTPATIEGPLEPEDPKKQLSDKAKEELSRTISDTGLEALLGKLGKGREQLFDPMGTPMLESKKNDKGKVIKGTWVDRDGNEYSKIKGKYIDSQGNEPKDGEYVGTVAQAQDYITHLKESGHPHHEHFSEIRNMDILDKDGKPTGEKVGQHIDIMEPELGTVINKPLVVETPVVETPVVETPEADADAKKAEESGDTPEPEVLEAAENISPEVEAIAKTLLKSGFAKRVACERGLTDKDGNPTEMGKAFFEQIGPMVNEAVDHFEKHKDTIATKFNRRRGMNFRDKEGNIVGIGNSGTFLNHLIDDMNKVAVAKGLPTLEKTHNDRTGEALTDNGVPVEPNQAPDLSVVNGEMVRNRLLTSRIGNDFSSDHGEFIAGLGGIQQIEQSILENKGMNPDTAKKITEEKLKEVKSGIESDEIKVADAGEKIHNSINETVATDYPDIAETPPDYGKQLPLFEDMGFEPMSTPEPTSAADAVAKKGVKARQRRANLDEEIHIPSKVSDQIKPLLAHLGHDVDAMTSSDVMNTFREVLTDPDKFGELEIALKENEEVRNQFVQAHVAMEQAEEEDPRLAHAGLPGFGAEVEDWGKIPDRAAEATQKIHERYRRKNLSPRKRQVEDLKNVMHGDFHEHLDNPDDMSDKEIKEMWNKEVRDPKARTASSASAGAKPTEKDKPNRTAALERLARLQNPDLIGDDDEVLDQDAMTRATTKLERHYDPSVGFTLKDITDAVKAQTNLVANQEAQQKQEKQNRARGVDQIRAVAEFEDNFPDPDKWAKEHDGEKMSPEMAKEHFRELIDFQHRKENFQHFDPKSGDPENFKALRERVHEYANLNPSAAREIAEEIKSAQRNGIDLGSDEFLAHAKELKETVERDERTAFAKANHKNEKLAHALENGNFSRGYDKDGNDGHRGLDHNGDPEHDTSEIKHEDAKAPLVHAVDENGYPDDKLQQLVNEIHDAELAIPKGDREHHEAESSLRAAHEAAKVDEHKKTTDAHTANTAGRDRNYDENDAKFDADIENSHQRQRDANYARVSGEGDRQKVLLDNHKKLINEAVDAHERQLAQHDGKIKKKQDEYNAYHQDIDKANKQHKKNVGDASADRMNAIYEAEQKAKKARSTANDQLNSILAEQIKQHNEEVEQHNQQGMDIVVNADASFADLAKQQTGQLANLRNKLSKTSEQFYQKQQDDSNVAAARGASPEYLGNLTQQHKQEAAEFDRGSQQQVADLHQSHQTEIEKHANNLGQEGKEWTQAGTDLLLNQAEERQKLTDDGHARMERIDAAVAHTDATARKTENDAINQSRDIRNKSLQEVADAAGLEAFIEDDGDATRFADQMRQEQSSHETDSAIIREQIQTDHGDYVESKRRGFKSEQGKMFAQATRAGDASNEEFEKEREGHIVRRQRENLYVTNDFEILRDKIDNLHGKLKRDAKKNFNVQKKRLGTDKKVSDQAALERKERAHATLDEYLKDDPEKLAAIKKNPQLGEHQDKVQQAHEEAGSGPTGEKDAKGEDKKPEKTRMVKDPKTEEMKKQYWIPGRGKGWVDEDTYRASHGQNAAAAKNNKLVIYPQGHFDAGHGQEGDEDYRPMSPPMAGHGANMFSIHTPDHPDAGLHDDELDHEGVMGSHLGNQPGITDHENFTANGAPFEVDLDSVGLRGMAEAAGKGKGQARDPESKREKIGRQFGGVEAQRRAGTGEFAAYGQAAKAVGRKFTGALDYVNSLRGEQGQRQSAVQQFASRMGSGDGGDIGQHVANALRGARQRGRKALGGVYSGGFAPKNERQAKAKVELWRRLPGFLREIYSLRNQEHARQLDHIRDIEDRNERKSSMDQWREWSKGIHSEIESRPKM